MVASSKSLTVGSDQKTGQIFSLNHLTKLVIREKDIDKIFELICKETAEQLSVSRTSIWKYYPDFGIVKCLKQYERSTSTFEAGLVLAEVDCPGLFAELRKEEFLESAQALSDARIPNLKQNYLIPLDIKSILYVPYYIEGELGGVICLEQQKEERNWLEYDKIHTQAVSEMVTIALIQHNLVEAMNMIRLQNDAILNHNLLLENKVKERTLEVQRKNEILKNVLNLNANQINSSISTIVGLLNLLDIEKYKNQSEQLLPLLKVPVNNLATIVKKINSDLLNDTNTPSAEANAYLPEE